MVTVTGAAGRGQTRLPILGPRWLPFYEMRGDRRGSVAAVLGVMPGGSVALVLSGAAREKQEKEKTTTNREAQDVFTSRVIQNTAHITASKLAYCYYPRCY